MPLTHRIVRLRQRAKGDSHMRERLLGGSRFTRQNVIDVTGVAQHQLHNWVSRNWLTLSGEQNPGKGRRRLYAGSDAINVAFGLELQPFGLMQVADRLAPRSKSPAVPMECSSTPNSRVDALLPSSRAARETGVMSRLGRERQGPAMTSVQP